MSILRLLNEWIIWIEHNKIIQTSCDTLQPCIDEAPYSSFCESPSSVTVFVTGSDKYAPILLIINTVNLNEYWLSLNDVEEWIKIRKLNEDLWIKEQSDLW